MVAIESKLDPVGVSLSRSQAAALLHASEVGVAVIRALELATDTTNAQAAIRRLKNTLARAGRESVSPVPDAGREPTSRASSPRR